MRIIDADGHVLERDIPWADLLEAPYRSRAPRAVKDNRGFTFVMIDGKLTPKPVGKALQLRRRAAQPPSATDDGHGRSRAASERHGSGRHRYRRALRHLAFSEPAVCRRQRFGLRRGARLQQLAGRLLQGRPAAAEGRGCGRDPGSDGSGKGTTPRRGRTEIRRRRRRRRFRHRKKISTIPISIPFFAEAQRLNVPVCIHVGAGDGVPAATERFDHPLYTHAMAHPFEQMIASLCVVAGGLLERFPRLKFAFMEAGCGWVPYWMERLDEHYEILQPTVPWLTKPPSEYMKSGQMFYAFEMEEKMLPYVAEFVGADRLVFATDYNHSDSKFPHTVEEVMERKDLSDAFKAKIMGENAPKLYNL